MTVSWMTYVDTVLVFSGPPEYKIAVDQAVGENDRMYFHEIGFTGEFVVFTAENPSGQAIDAGENAQRTQDLYADLTDRGIYFRLVDGYAPDMSVHEASVAAAVSVDVGRELGEKYGQLAVFWYDGSDFWVVEAKPDGGMQKLPL